MLTRDYLANRMPVPTGTLTQLFFESVDRFGDRVAFRGIRDEGFREFTYRQVLQQARAVGAALTAMGLERGNRIASDLIARGLHRGERFALMMRNHPEFVETMIAASISATVLVPIDPRRGEPVGGEVDGLHPVFAHEQVHDVHQVVQGGDTLLGALAQEPQDELLAVFDT